MTKFTFDNLVTASSQQDVKFLLQNNLKSELSPIVITSENAGEILDNSDLFSPRHNLPSQLGLACDQINPKANEYRLHGKLENDTYAVSMSKVFLFKKGQYDVKPPKKATPRLEWLV